jgi:peptide/nickel transport system permease protein
MGYLIRRTAQALLVLFLAVSLSFALFRLLPGGPTQAIRAQLIEQAQRTGGTVNMERINRLVGVYTGVDPDQPIHVAYYEYMRDIVLYQDFGTSIWKGEPVFTYLFARVPWSIFLSVYGLVIGRTVGLLLGAVMAYKEGSKVDTSLTVFTILSRSVPYYVVAIALLIVFGFNLEWFPTGGRTAAGTSPGMNVPYMIGLIQHAALPITTTLVAGFGSALAFRGNCVREMGKSYIRVARLRGVSDARLSIRYIGRNAFLPIYTGLMIGMTALFGSSIIIETIFSYPAMGFATFNALVQRDYPLLMGTFIFFTTITVFAILIADLTYGIIDPRVRGGGERESF